MVDDYKIELKICGVDWINLAEDIYLWRALVNTAMKLQKFGKRLE
jgi:hypothetical protein